MYDYDNVEAVACDFCDWANEYGYLSTKDEIEQLDTIVSEFNTIRKAAPKTYNLLKKISIFNNCK